MRRRERHSHPCELCRKTYKREDLRNRHQRRCAQALSQGRVPRQIACKACAQSKTRCDHLTPTCSRCAARNLECFYPDMNGTEEESSGFVSSRLQPHNTIATSLPSNESLSDGFTDSTEVLGAVTEDWDMGMDLAGNISDSLLLQRLLDPFHTGSFYLAQPVQAVAESASAPQDTSHTSTERLSMTENLDHNFQSESSLTQTDANARSITDGPFTSEPERVQTPSNVGQVDRSDAGSQHYYTTNTIAGGTLQNKHDGQNDRSGIPAKAREYSRTRFVGAASMPSPSCYYDDATTLAIPELASLARTENLVSAVMKYPKDIICQDCEPPFVHHLFFDREKGKSDKALAVAICVLSAHASRQPSSSEYLDSLINTEKVKLILEFTSLSSAGSMIAAVQAITLYQIIGLFNQSDTQQRLTSQLHQPFVLKMARELYNKHYFSFMEPNSKDEWQQWAVLETMIRTLLLVHIVNILSCAVDKQSEFYFEPLGDEIVLDLPLPAPGQTWRAKLVEEWQACRKQDAASGHTGLKMKVFIKELYDSAAQNYAEPNGRRLQQRFSDMDELSKMAVACALRLYKA